MSSEASELPAPLGSFPARHPRCGISTGGFLPQQGGESSRISQWKLFRGFILIEKGLGKSWKEMLVSLYTAAKSKHADPNTGDAG